jgi:hypothetical protein
MTYLIYGYIAAIISIAFIMASGPDDAYSHCQIKHSADYCYSELKP